MKQTIMTLISLLFTLAGAAQTTTYYSWEAPDGTVAETGGTITQHNNLAISRINYPSSGHHAILLCGKKENVKDENNSADAVYFTITLADGRTFCAGDEITVTAMRNNDTGGKASIHFVFGGSTVSDVTLDDSNTWANLGQMHEMNFSGGTKAKGADDPQQAETTAAGTEPVGSFSLDTSTNTFVVPAAADGATSLILTRNDSDCMLYITKISIAGKTVTDINEASADGTAAPAVPAYTLTGQQVNDAATGIVVVNGRKYVRY